MSKKQYTTYDERTGRITGAVFARVPPINTTFLEGTYDAEKTRIVNGVPTDRGESEVREERANHAQQRMRGLRDRKLQYTDWTQMPDSPLSEQERQQWASYRQHLRDLPANTPDPLNVTWPEPPTRGKRP